MPEPSRAAAFFPTTCWSQVGPDAGEQALERLAVRYREPIEEWLRAALRLDRDAASELAQDFFLWVMESGFLRKADRERGRFRAFLKVALGNYARDARRRSTAERRGGGRAPVSLDASSSDSSDTSVGEALDPADPSSPRPDELLDARWRRELVQGALAQLEQELAASGRAPMFATFRDYFLDPAPDVDYRAVADRHGISVTDVSNWLARTKKRFRDHLRSEVLETVRDAESLEEELRWLFGKDGG